MEGMREEGEIVDASKHEVVVSIDDKWVNSVSKRVEGSRQHTKWEPDVATIYRVSPAVRAGNRKAYEPSMVSIGPYHRGKKHLQTMEELKWQYVNHHISRCPEKRIGKYLGKMKELEAQTRRCYSEEIKLSSNAFVEMMLLDGCFLVQILLHPGLRGERPEQQLGETLWFDHLLVSDLLKLENQLPFFIVEFFLHEYMPELLFTFKDRTIEYFRLLLPRATEWGNPKNIDFQTFKPHHLIHLFYECYFSLKAQGKRKLQNLDQTLPPGTIDSAACSCSWYPLYPIKTKIVNQQLQHLDSPPMKRLPSATIDSAPSKRMPCATQLVEAGVKLKSRDKKMFLDISFDRGVLEIPPLNVDDSTNCILRNIIALEQCCPKRFGNVVTCYTIFMDSIINTPRDVALLQEEGIMENHLGDNVLLASLFNNIGKNIIYAGEDYLAGETKGVNIHCERTWPKWRARLMHDYFNNPWAIISLIAAVFLLVLTVTQTVYSILSYHA